MQQIYDALFMLLALWSYTDVKHVIFSTERQVSKFVKT